MRKYRSIIELNRRGLNTLPTILWDGSTTVGDLCRELGKNPLGIRTERGSDTHCPFIIGLTADEAHERASEFYIEGYEVMVSQSVPPEDNLVNGNLAMPERSEPFIEYYSGPGTQRDIADHSLKRVYMFHPPPDQEAMGLLNHLYQAIRRLPVGIIAEWSICGKRRGYLHRRDLWWELRPF